jgi:hypothetical protein
MTMYYYSIRIHSYWFTISIYIYNEKYYTRQNFESLSKKDRDCSCVFLFFIFYFLYWLVVNFLFFYFANKGDILRSVGECRKTALYLSINRHLILKLINADCY